MLALESLRVGYGGRSVIAALSIAPLQPGHVVSLLGPNGSGKSTLLKALAGLLRPAAGRIVLDGQDLDRSVRAPAARTVLVPQFLPAAAHLTVLESVVAAVRAGMGDRPGVRADVPHCLATLRLLGIAHLALAYLDELSGGQQQLAGLAQALACEPRLLLLDEPLSALDLNFQWHVMDVLMRETRVRGLVTLIALHDLDTALRCSDETILMRQGSLVAQGRPADVITTGTLREVYQVEARVERGPGGRLHVLVEGLNRPVT